MKQIYLLILAVGLLSEVSGQMPDWQWAVRGGSAISTMNPTDDDVVVDMITDSEGNTYIYGEVVQFAKFDTFQIQGFGALDYALVKYNCHGKVEWARFLGGGQSAYAGGMTLGPNGDVYINGITEAGGTSLNWTLHDTIIYQQYPSYFQIAFDPEGKRKRMFFANYLVGSVGLDLTTADGYIYALGRGNGGVFAQGHSIDTGTYIMKMDTLLNIQWIKTIMPGFPMVGKRLILKSDASKNLYVAGRFRDSMVIGDTVLHTFFNPQFNQYIDNGFLAKFAVNGDFVWVNAFGRYWGGGIEAITFGNNSIFISGSGSDSIIMGKDTLHYPDPKVSGAFVAKFDLNGNAIWGRANGGAGGIALSPDEENVWVTGSVLQTAYFDTFQVTATNTVDPILAKYDTAGNVLFATNISSSGTYQDRGYLVTTDPNGNAYVSGTFEQTFMTGDTFPSYGGKRDIFLVKYGVELCADTSSGGVGLAAEAAEIFKIYPNPATSSVYLTFEEEPQLVQVYDFNGRLVAAFNKEQMTNGNVELDVSTWATGLYLVSVTGEEGRSVVRKLVKME